jgi:hypothetical protein
MVSLLLNCGRNVNYFNACLHGDIEQLNSNIL